MFGCAYWRIADEECSSMTLRCRHDEWIEAGGMDALRKLVLEVYNRFIGLELSDEVADCCITKAPSGSDRAGRSPADRDKRASHARRSSTLEASPRDRRGPGQPPRLAAFG